MQVQQLSVCTEALYQNIQGELTLKQKREYKEIDKAITMAKLTVERMCQKIKAGNHGWTPKLTIVILAVLYWKGLAKCKKGGRVGKEISKKKRSKRRDTALNREPQNRITETQKNVQCTEQHLHKLQANKDHRQMWLGQLIVAQVEAANLP